LSWGQSYTSNGQTWARRRTTRTAFLPLPERRADRGARRARIRSRPDFNPGLEARPAIARRIRHNNGDGTIDPGEKIQIVQHHRRLGADVMPLDGAPSIVIRVRRNYNLILNTTLPIARSSVRRRSR
jgi:hypothetical protein